MTLRLNRSERRQALAYRAMVRAARRRSKHLLACSSHAPSNTSHRYRRRGRLIAPDHKAAIAELFCVATAARHGVEIYGVQVAHLRFSNAAVGAANPGLQRKPDDRWVLPLSPVEHRLQHRMNEAAYWKELELDPHALASKLWSVTPDARLMEEMLRAAISGRERLLKTERETLEPLSILYTVGIAGLFVQDETK
jgi:hypothetical protein